MLDHDAAPEDTESSDPIYYVGVGASAGGLEALESFFTQMPADSGMAFIVIQHLSPDYKSMMVELLSKRTAMLVQRAEEGLRVEANSVYLIPPKKNLSIFHGKLLLANRITHAGSTCRSTCSCARWPTTRAKKPSASSCPAPAATGCAVSGLSRKPVAW